MNLFFSADYILTGTGTLLRKGVVEIEPSGKIVALHSNVEDINNTIQVQYFKGVIVPGFINAHCHLELSHMLGKIPKKTGLVEFIKAISTSRKADKDTILKAMQQADKQMYTNGIVAIGDHSNSSLSVETKQKSPIHYHTFLELIGFEPENAQTILDSVLKIQQEFGSLPSTITPHAPYSVSKEIFKQLKHLNNSEGPLSIHNQESEEENKFFRYKKGDFLKLYEWMGKDISFFKAQSRSSIQCMATFLPEEQNIQLVHNTFTSIKDVIFISRMDKKIFWCLCPSANLYIEDRLPKVDLLLHAQHCITIGTDSLASNDSLCILNEMKILSQHFPNIKFTEMLTWATYNGAVMLGLDLKLGSIEPGKYPGLNLLENMHELTLTDSTKVTKLI